MKWDVNLAFTVAGRRWSRLLLFLQTNRDSNKMRHENRRSNLSRDIRRSRKKRFWLKTSFWMMNAFGKGVSERFFTLKSWFENSKLILSAYLQARTTTSIIHRVFATSLADPRTCWIYKHKHINMWFVIDEPESALWNMGLKIDQNLIQGRRK